MQTAQYACRQCAEAKKHCDKLMPTCSRCEKYEFSCDIGKKPRNKPKLRSEKACAKVTQDHVVTTCLERISHCLALEALEKDDQSQAAENDEAPQTGSFEEQARQRIEDSISRLPPAEVMESLHRAASFHQSIPLGEGLYNFLDGTALIAFSLLAEEMVKYACEPFVAQEKRQENEDQEDQPS